MSANDRLWRRGYDDAVAGRQPNPDADDDGFEYDRGYQAGLEADEDTAPAKGDTSSSSRRSGPSSSRRSGPSSKRRSGPRPKRRSSTGRKATKAITAPVTRQVGSAIGVLGTAVVIALLYNLLTHTKAAGGALGALAAAVAWLDDPTRSIPYRS